MLTQQARIVCRSLAVDGQNTCLSRRGRQLGFHVNYSSWCLTIRVIRWGSFHVVNLSVFIVIFRINAQSIYIEMVKRFEKKRSNHSNKSLCRLRTSIPSLIACEQEAISLICCIFSYFCEIHVLFAFLQDTILYTVEYNASLKYIMH